jgi:hypothetical protein
VSTLIVVVGQHRFHSGAQTRSLPTAVGAFVIPPSVLITSARPTSVTTASHTAF